jgi:hypothetical protein
LRDLALQLQQGFATGEMGLRLSLHGSNLGPVMSALGQKRTWPHFRSMSALPPKADIGTQSRNVRFVPKADILRCSKNVVIRSPGRAGIHKKIAELSHARSPSQTAKGKRDGEQKFCVRSKTAEPNGTPKRMT